VDLESETVAAACLEVELGGCEDILGRCVENAGLSEAEITDSWNCGSGVV
jgi:hypothetical protein